MLKVEELKFTFKKGFSLDVSSFTVSEGKIHGLFGQNGAGKTTLIKTIVGGIPKFEGTITLEDKDIIEARREGQISYIPERTVFEQGIKVEGYLKQQAGLANIKNHKQAIEQVMKLFLLEQFAKKKADSLSSGWKKKLTLAGALLEKPKLLILDEPTANLDPNARVEFFSILKQLKKSGVSILIASHILDEAFNVIDEYSVMSHGKISFDSKTKPKTVAVLKKKFEEHSDKSRMITLGDL